jgi:hypothetical protein
MDVNGSEDCEPTMNISMFNGDIDVMYPILVFVTKVTGAFYVGVLNGVLGVGMI